MDGYKVEFAVAINVKELPVPVDLAVKDSLGLRNHLLERRGTRSELNFYLALRFITVFDVAQIMGSIAIIISQVPDYVGDYVVMWRHVNKLDLQFTAARYNITRQATLFRIVISDWP